MLILSVMTNLRLKNNLRGDIEAFMCLLHSGKKLKNKIKRVSEKKGVIEIEGVIHFEDK